MKFFEVYAYLHSHSGKQLFSSIYCLMVSQNHIEFHLFPGLSIDDGDGMRDKEIMIVGLGNPGEQYCNNRHNAGFLVVDELAKRWTFSVSKEKWNAKYCSFSLSERKIHALKPLTFMNLSGKAVVQHYNFFKMDSTQLLVIHDDLDMAPGRIKLVKGGGAGGHNGIKSIANILGTKDFYRLKIGIGRPGQGEVHQDFPVEKYVLGNFSDEELDIFRSRFDGIDKGLRLFVQGDPSKAMNLLNSLK